jgi:hypothetical protein
VSSPVDIGSHTRKRLPHLSCCALIALTTALSAQTVEPSFFSEKLYPVFEAAQCRVCHTRDGVASATRLHFPEMGTPASDLQLFGLSLDKLINRAAPANSALLGKPTNRIQHTGGERVKPGSEEEKLLAAWVNYLAATAPESLEQSRRRLISPRGPGQPDERVRRLTHSQYNNTVRDLLGDFSKPAQRFPAEDYVDGFKNQLRHQGMPPLLVESYSAAAEKLALNAFRAGDINGLVPCKPASAEDARCRDQFIRTFGARAFRRPLRDMEVQRYSAAFRAQAGATRKFLEGARAVVEAMLQSPKFLFHVEAGPDGRSRESAIASRLSYFIWDTMPDKALTDAAAKGDLRTPEGRERAVRRMLDNPLAAEALDEFLFQWLRLDRVLNASKAQRRYPEFSPELAAAMVEETRRLFRHIVSNDRNFLELLTADYGFLSSDLASLYKFSAPRGQFEMVSFPANTRRAGLLGHASILTSTAGPIETSPTSRGIFVREQLLCQHVPPPPPNVNTTLAGPTEARPLTRRQRLSEHVTNPGCAACHRLMDPIGFGLESFDAIGRWRDKETILVDTDGENNRARTKRFDLPLETGGEIAGLPNSSFSDARQLGRIVADSKTCQECIVRQIFRYAHGRRETAADQPAIDRLFAAFRDSGFRFKTLLIEIVKSPEFIADLDDNVSQRSAQASAGARR